MIIDETGTVQDAMNANVLQVGPDHTLRQCASAMASRKVGAAIIVDPDRDGVGIITERDVLIAVANGQDPNVETVGAHLTSDVVFAAPQWPVLKAAQTMLNGGFRHLVVLEGGDVAGVLSVRDVVRAWVEAETL
jgi:signal-transduction protein with cAMP-binding, CBS, and nucleotidyltransferase domain